MTAFEEQLVELMRSTAYLAGDTLVAGRPDPARAAVVSTSTKDRKSTRLNSSHVKRSRMPSSA